MNWALPVCAALLLALLGGATGCSSSGQAFETVIVSGSTTVLPIAEEAAQQFEDVDPGIHVLVSGMGSSGGIEAVSSGTANIGTSSRELKESEEDLGLNPIVVAHDGIAVIVHEDNPVEGLTTQQLRQIFAGEITNWSQVGGEDRSIILINRDEASGTREAFAKIVMDETRFDIGAVILPGTGQVREVVTRTPGAIGYISVGFVEPRFIKSHVKALPIDGVEPTEDRVADNTYPISRNLYFFTLGQPEGATKAYIDYVLSEPIQQGPVIEAGFVPVRAGAQSGGGE